MKNPPPGAKGFFMGDSLGGAGWHVELPDGTQTKYYVSLPRHQVEVNFYVADPPTTHLGKTLPNTSITEMARLYVVYLHYLLAEASERFSH